MKNIPILYDKKENCSGCSACMLICPVKAISMIADSEGFKYPHIDSNICIRCNKCQLICYFKQQN